MAGASDRGGHGAGAAGQPVGAQLAGVRVGCVLRVAACQRRRLPLHDVRHTAAGHRREGDHRSRPARLVETLRYEVTGRVARITLDRPERGNGITMAMPRELTECVEQANLDRNVHVIALSGEGKGFCGGYDLVEYAEHQPQNHDPSQPWDPVLDYQFMGRNVRGFMSLFHSDKPVVCKVHGFCVAGGTDMALCSDLLVIEDAARIGYPPARVWGVPTTAMWTHRLGPQRAKRLLFTGDLITGAQALDWGLAIEAPAAADLG